MTRQLLTTLILACVCGSTGRASAYSLKQVNGNTVRWRADAIQLTVAAPGGPREPNINEVVAAGQAAASAWNAVPDVPSITVGRGNAGEWGYNPAGRQVNGVYVLDEWPLDIDALAVTVTSIDGATGELLDADVLINATHPYAGPAPRIAVDPQSINDEHPRPPSSDRGNRPDGVTDTASAGFDIQSVLTHELGHVLGLDEEPEEPLATMFPRLRPGETHQRTLEADDRDGAQAAYAAPLPSASGCSATGTDAIPDVTLLGLFLILLLRNRGRTASRVSSGRSGTRAISLLALVLGGACTQQASEDAPRTVHGVGVVDEDDAHLTAAGFVTGLSTTLEHGMIWTEVEVTTTDGTRFSYTAPGGSRAGVIQVVSGHEVPEQGDALVWLDDETGRRKLALHRAGRLVPVVPLRLHALESAALAGDARAGL